MDGNDYSDIELVDRLLRGVPGAFDLFYRRHERLIYHCIRRRADAADVSDLFQSFFERLVERDYRVLKLWQRGTSLPIYLSTVVRNFVIDFHRARSAGEKA
jgi:DNA-directed RNA polymerase specialized sigma24 family protein